MNDKTILRVGLFGIGLDAYWNQFAGLKERLEGYTSRVAERLQQPGVEVVNLGLVDTVEKRLTPAKLSGGQALTSCFSTSPRMPYLQRSCPSCAEPRFP